MDSFTDDALRYLRLLTAQPGAEFHPDQLEAIRVLVEERRRVLVVQRTGWGKSAVYFIATKMLRDRGFGPTVLISPLLALMRNQVDSARRMGVRAATVNSANAEEWDRIRDELDAGDVDVLLVSEQRLANERFRRDWLPELSSRVGLFVVDEVHCISDWGHDFRPHYRRIGRFLELLPRGVPVIGCTATANDRVVADVETQLGEDLLTVRGPLSREGLRLEVITRLPEQSQRLAWLAEHIPQLRGTGIVYCLTVDDAHMVSDFLRGHGIDSSHYTGADDDAHKQELEHRFLSNDLKVVVATSALGMGYDKPDVGFVIHYQVPPNPITYYQQVGRAGRALDESWGIVLAGAEDRAIQDWFIETAFPGRDEADAVVGTLADADDPLTVPQIQAVVNIKKSRLDSMLVQLDVDGVVEKIGPGWTRTLASWSYPAKRVEAVTGQRRHEQEVMARYLTTDRCRMAFLGSELDDPRVRDCGICDNCTGRRFGDDDPDGELEREARDELQHRYVVRDPRKMWVSLPDGPSGRIPAEERCEKLHMLARWEDGGWGSLVRRGKQEDGHFDDQLVDAVAEMLERVALAPRPEWITFVPSLRHPDLVPSFAARLGARLGLAVHDVVRKVREAHPQKTRENSAQQLGNLSGVFSVQHPPLLSPCLLVDDIIDSKWTVTVVGADLRRAGVTAVHPIGLADAG